MMNNSRALLLYSFTEYLTTANIPKNVDLSQAVHDQQIMQPFVNKLNQYAQLEAGLDNVDYIGFDKNKVQQELISIIKNKWKKERYLC